MQHSQSKHRGGFTVWEVVVIVVVVVLLAGLLFTALAGARSKARRISCISNLMQIGTATRIWAGDHGGRFPDQVPVTEGGLARTNATGLRPADVFGFFQVMSNELYTPKILLCRAHLTFLEGRVSFGA